MKKLSLFVALLLVATIGGVYATWNYVGSDQIHTFTTKGVIMEEVIVSGTVGEYSIESNFNQGRIDQAKGNDTDPSKYHKAELSYELKDSATKAKVRISFTPTATAGYDILNSGVITYLWFGDNGMVYKTDSNGNYDANGTENAIFDFTYDSENYITIHPVGTTLSAEQQESGNHFTWTKDGNSFYFDFINEETAPGGRKLEDMFTLNDFVLDVESEYHAFKSAINGFIRCVVSNKLPSQTTLS
ncbi:MAG: hypothetical protein IKC35_01305 [Clostridia bacterium]|nr:hypothetical protein [Clostridia bacterium]